MDSNLLRQLQQKLQVNRNDLMEQLKQITQTTSFDKDKVQAKWEDVGDKDEDNAVEVADFQDSISVERNLDFSLERVEKALGKIEQGEYGRCEKCGQSIEEVRLIAYPEADKCLKCTAKR